MRNQNIAGIAGMVVALILTAGAAHGQCVSRTYTLLPNNPSDSYFGQSAAADGDWLAIGAYRSVRLFHRDASGWQPDTVLTSPYSAGDPGDYGTAVALAGDLLIVQAPSRRGVVIYRRGAAGWAEETRLQTAKSGTSGTLSLLRAADTTLVAVGLPTAKTVYVYGCAAGAWRLEATLTASDAASDSSFGGALALTDTTPYKLLVGDPGDDDNGTHSGSVYAFTRDAAGTWAFTAKIKPAQGAADDGFGYRLAVSGPDLLVGAFPAARAVYHFTATAGGWTERGTLGFVDSGDPSGTMLLVARGDTAVTGRYGTSSYYLLRRSAQTWSVAARLELPTDDAPYLLPWAGALLPDQAILGNSMSIHNLPGTVRIANLVDCNTNGLLDGCDLAAGTSLDCNSNGIPDECELDCNGNGIPDDCDIAADSGLDCDQNGRIDSCDVAAGLVPDCNGNGIPDSCDVAPVYRWTRTAEIPAGSDTATVHWTGLPPIKGTAAEVEITVSGYRPLSIYVTSDAAQVGSVSPITCDPNCTPYPPQRFRIPAAIVANMNTTGNLSLTIRASRCYQCSAVPATFTATLVYFRATPTPDANTNGIPDACELAAGTASDCNTNGVPDDADVLVRGDQFESASAWSTFDPNAVLGTCIYRFSGALYDGRYTYFCPNSELAPTPFRGAFVRYDTRAPFDHPSSWAVYEVGPRIGPYATSYTAAAFDGRYVYATCRTVQEPTTVDVIVRYDTRAAFAADASWEIFGLAPANLGTQTYQGATFDGQRLYFAPLDSGKVLCYDTSGAFLDSNSWTIFDAAAAGIGGRFGPPLFDGRYVHFPPAAYSGVPSAPFLRYDTQAAFSAATSWQSFTPDTAGVTSARAAYIGGTFDGRYLYFSPSYYGTAYPTPFSEILRLDTTASYTDASSWRVFNTMRRGLGVEPYGFNRAAFDGRFVYLTPGQHAGAPSQPHFLGGELLRYDTTQDFDDLAAWSTFDPNTAGVTSTYSACTGGVCDGRYLYFPEFVYSVRDRYPRILRYDTRFGVAADANHDGVPDTCATCRGDANCDGTVNWRDIDFLIAAMNDNETAWAGLFGASAPGCNFASADVDADTHVNWRDIDPFILRMNQPCP